MLRLLRNKKIAKKIWVILAIVIVPAFVLWGSGSLMRSREETKYIGRIFGKKISPLDYKEAMDAVKNQAILEFGEDFSTKESGINLESQALYRLILLAEVKRRKIKVDDREVVGLIQSYPFFQRKGQFDKALYSQTLEYVFRTPARVFEEQIRQNIILSKLYNQVTDSVNLTDEEIKEAYRKEGEQISIYYIASIPSDFAKEVTVTEDDLKDYFARNSFEFKQPLSFNLEYVILDSEDKIKDFVSRLNKRESFDKLITDFNLALKETGLFAQSEPIPGIGWSQEIFNTISKVKTGELLPPVKTDKYYYLLRVKERKEPYIPELQIIKEKVKERFIKDKSRELAKEKIENCLKELKEEYRLNPKAIDFTNAAKTFALKSDSTSMFKYGSYIEGIGASDVFWMAAGDLKENEFSEIIETGSGSFYIIKLKSKIPIDEEKFESDKKDFTRQLLSQKKYVYFIKFAEELKRKSQGSF